MQLFHDQARMNPARDDAWRQARPDSNAGAVGPILLLSATINPPAGVPHLARTDPRERRRDYLDAFRFYLGLLGEGAGGLVLAENSQADLSELRALADASGHSARVELISFRGLDHPAEFGRAYGEFKLIDHAVAQSRLISEIGPDESVWKITGRYVVKNMRHLLVGRPDTFDLYCNIRRYPTPWAEMFLFAWKRRAYDTFLRGIYPLFRHELVAPLSPENKFLEMIEAVRGRLAVVPRFRSIPQLEGRRGMDNAAHGGWNGRAKYAARVIANRVAPWLWI